MEITTDFNQGEIDMKYEKNSKSNYKIRGRPANSGNIRLRPIFREHPDIAKLGRAIMSMAEKTEEKDSNDQP